jgi:2-dehydro-3-deoxygalactonokinase
MSKFGNISLIAADWGTSNLRVWGIDHQGKVVNTIANGKGMSSLMPSEFEPYLIGLIENWLPEEKNAKCPIIICGMAGAKTGWKEAAYLKAPCPPINEEKIIQLETEDQRISVSIIPGIMQKSPPDVMRGEETQIAGYLSKNPDFDGIICLPGTHTKWVHISAGEIVSFKTFMTGEIFLSLSERSILKSSVQSDDFDPTSFLEAFKDTYSNPALLSSKLFGLRAADLLENTSTKLLKSKLSGYLIGSELAGAKSYWLGQNIVMIGNDDLCILYQKALKKLGLNATIENTQNVTLYGLQQACRGRYNQ